MSLNDNKNGKTDPIARSGAAPLKPAASLLNVAPHIVNVGVPGFAEELASQGVSVVQLDWRPPAGGARLAKILSIVGT